MFRPNAILAALITALMLTGLSAAADHVGTTPTAHSQAFHIFALDSPARSPQFLGSLGLRQPHAVVVQQACCKVCTRGKACGNTCISQDKQCHVGPGCACDG
jgi:hypothetical protein